MTNLRATIQMQQLELAQIRQREANLAALAAIGPRKKRKTDSPVRGASADVSKDYWSVFTLIKRSLNPCLVFSNPLRAQVQAPPSPEAQEAPDSSHVSASLESTCGTCSSAWRTRKKPATRSCSTKGSSNSSHVGMKDCAATGPHRCLTLNRYPL